MTGSGAIDSIGGSLRLRRSHELWKRASQIIPGGTQTLSKGADQFVQGVAPVFLERGQGAHVWDVDGNEYVDYMMALGPVVLGYADQRVNDSIARQLSKGIQFSLSHPVEVEVAELVIDAVPCAEMVRFGKNGSDATAGAVRLSRAITARDRVAVCGYHGWQDWFIGSTTRNKGVPADVRALTQRFRYNDIDHLQLLLKSHPGEFAAVILEPIHAEEPLPGFLKAVAEVTRASGALLVFDETKTGFRFGLGGAQAHFDVVPDLACFGKAVANGMPLSILAGREEFMRRMTEVFFSFTAGGETLSLAAAKTTIEILRDTDALKSIWSSGQVLKDGYNAASRKLGLEKTTWCEGLAPMTVCAFRDDRDEESLLFRSLFQQEMIDRGILFDDGFVLCEAHSSDDISRTLHAISESLAILRAAIAADKVAERIRGVPIKPLF